MIASRKTINTSIFFLHASDIDTLFVSNSNYNMGVNFSGPTQQEQLTTLIQKQIVDVMSNQKFKSASSISQTTNIIALGKESKNTGVDIKQVASINTTAFLNDKTALELKSDLKDKIANSIKNEASDNPLGKQQNVNTKIANVVDKSIETKFSRESLIELNNSVNQAVNVAAIAGGENTVISVYQKGDVIAQFTSDVATDIASQLIGSSDVDNKSDMKTTNFFSETIASIGKAVGDVMSSVLTGVYAGPVIMFVMFMCVVLIAIYIAKGGSRKPSIVYQPMHPPIPPMGGTTPADFGIDVSTLPHVR